MASSYIGFNRPKFTELYNRIISDINNTLPGQDASLPNTPLNILATTITGGFNELYSYLDFMSNQTNVLYATGANLDLFGQIWGVIRKAATASSGLASYTGIPGYTLPVGTLVQTSTGIQFTVNNPPSSGSISVDGVPYSPTAGAALPSTNGIAYIEAVKTGDNNLASGALLTLVNPVSGININFLVISLTGGASIETDDSYRTRILNRISTPPFGGNQNDYVNWMLSRPNVTRAWCYPLEQGPGTVVCRFAMDKTTTNGIPGYSDIVDMQNYLNTVKPITANVIVTAQYTQSINLTIANLFPNTADIQTAIANELNALFTRVGDPGAIIYWSWIVEAITLATGTQHFNLTTPSDDIVLPTGAIPVLGIITYT